MHRNNRPVMWRAECMASVAVTPDYLGEGRSDVRADGRAGSNGRVPVWVRVRRTAETFVLQPWSSFRANDEKDVVMRTCSNGKLFLKSESRTDASNISKKDACAPTPTSSVVLALAHACASFAVDVAMVKSAEASRFRNTLLLIMLKAVNPTSTCGMRWPVASNVRPTSGLVETVTSTTSLSMGYGLFGAGWLVEI